VSDYLTHVTLVLLNPKTRTGAEEEARFVYVHIGEQVFLSALHRKITSAAPAVGPVPHNTGLSLTKAGFLVLERFEGNRGHPENAPSWRSFRLRPKTVLTA
jgi:hypothetical protein